MKKCVVHFYDELSDLNKNTEKEDEKDKKTEKSKYENDHAKNITENYIEYLRK